MAVRLINTGINPFAFQIRRGLGLANVFSANLGPGGSTSASVTVPFSLEECNRDAGFRSVTSGATPRVRVTEIAESNAIGGAIGALTGGTAGGLGSTFTIHVPLASGGTSGTADAVNCLASLPGGALPFQVRVVDVIASVSTAVAGSNVQLHNTASGGGSTTYSTALSSAATGKVRDASTTMALIPAGGTLFARRSDRSVVGELAVVLARVA
jgi:hypothetical protein